MNTPKQEPREENDEKTFGEKYGAIIIIGAIFGLVALMLLVTPRS